MTKVLLINMPFVSISRPAIGISTLSAVISSAGFRCDVVYPNITFAEGIGADVYSLINEKASNAMFLGDWLFAQHLFSDKLDTDTYINTLCGYLNDDENLARILDVRKFIGPFLQDCLSRFNVAGYDIIGFTSTFEQNLASLVLANKIKEVYPDKVIVFGGGNCSGIMGLALHRNFEWIDYVCCGEAEVSFLQLVNAIDKKDLPEAIPGIIYRKADKSVYTSKAQLLDNLDELPIPDYCSYYDAIRGSTLASDISPSILVETSRGCWWGAKSHCSFCGLNGESLRFRSKSASRAFEEFRFLKDRYKINRLVAVDNIMDMTYFADLLPLLKETPLGISIFYETKANLTKEQVRLLRDTGINAIQSGIESISSHALKLMRKGSSALRNIQLLKWCREYHITVAWNLLYGIPGEKAEDYEWIKDIIGSLYHLSPPYAVGPIRLDRFSPYFDNPASYSITAIKPFSMYSFIYPLPQEEISDIAYFFEYKYTDNHDPLQYMKEILPKIESWKAAGDCYLRKQYKTDREILIVDTRPDSCFHQIALTGIQCDIYNYCDNVRSLQSISKFASSHYHVPPDFQVRLCNINMKRISGEQEYTIIMISHIRWFTKL